MRMHAAARPLGAAGLALAASTAIAVAPIAVAPDRVGAGYPVRLAAGGFADPLGVLENTLNSLASAPVLTELSNVLVNIIEDVANIPYNESLALEEYAFALGPPDSVGGVPGWIPPGTPSADVVNGMYPVGGTGSWWMESVGNTWGWNDGNFPQLDALLSFLLPFPSFTQPLADELQILGEAWGPSADSACPFECSNLLALLGGWFQVPITRLLAGYTLPTTYAHGEPIIWSGQTVQLQPLLPFESFLNSLTATPTGVHLPNLLDVLVSGLKLTYDLIYDFTPIETGSFLYWGASTLYGVPALLAGLIDGPLGIHNPIPTATEDYSMGILSLLPGLATGIASLPKDVELEVGALFSGIGSELSSFAHGAAGLLADLTRLLGDPSALLGDLTPSLSGGAAALSSMLGADLAANLGLALPHLATALIP